MSAKVVVTGAGGYIGRHVVQELLERGDEVVAIARSGDEWLRTVLPADQIIERSAFDLTEDDWARIEGADALIHLAWRDGFVLRSRAHGQDLSAHYDFLMTAADRGVRRIAPLGTMHEIGYWEGPVDAETPSRATTPYGIAKTALRQLLGASLSDGATDLVWLRCYYIVGDDVRSNSIFNKILAADARGDAEFPFTTGKNLYDFIDVDELAVQIRAAALDQQVTGTVECCSGTPQSLADAVEAFIARHGLSITLAYGAFPDRPFDSPGVWGDAGRITEVLHRQSHMARENSE
ncbi:NAD-dependent epimerase/dehydratase family protein [Microbacterium sp. NPDC056569]|uniref:NAD-dependent epimerase/dehydratase family protein n=1 Tax=Microbacterium sp. NPDC056569 TaxID=3345867 RepID=UPI00366F3628